MFKRQTWRIVAMSALGLLLATLLQESSMTDAQATFQVSPSLGNGGITFPIFSGSEKQPLDQWTAETSAASHQVVTVVPPPANKISPGASYKPYSDGFFPSDYNVQNKSRIDYPTLHNYLGDDYTSQTASRMPGYAPAPNDSRNGTSRFFTLNTGRQTLDLGLSFTVPFLSIPMTSLMNFGQNFGENTFSALNSLLAINWQSVILIGVAIIGAAFLLPQVATLITQITGGGSSSAYTSSYGRTDREGTAPLPVEPFAAILNQIDDAMAQYDLDSTSCMQRAVCSYVAGSEESVIEGEPDASELIITGLARSSWMQSMLGQTAIADAVDMGLKEGHCQVQYPKCPFSIGGVLRFLAAYATLTNSNN